MTTKLAWPHDLNAVAGAGLPPHVQRDLARGRALGQTALDAGREVPRLARNLGRGADALLRPAGPAATALLKGVAQEAKDLTTKHPAVGRAAVGAAIAGPMLAAGFHGSKDESEESLMHLRQDPSLDAFLEKKAALMTYPAIGGKVQDSFLSGIGSGLAQGVLGALGSAIGGGVSGLRDLLVRDRQQRTIFETVIATDAVLRDKLQHNPQALGPLKEAFATMCRFAPSLAVDLNAVRSFLREVAMSGAGVNYATIKNLIDTERASRDAHRNH